MQRKTTTKFMLAAGTCLMLAGNMQAQTVRKVVLEEFTGAWCGWCPEGAEIVEQIATQNPINMIAIANHNGDGLQIPDGAAIQNGLSVTGYPNADIDRFKFAAAAKIPVSRGQWATYFNERKTVPAIASVSIANLTYVASTNKYEADIKVKFTSAPVAGVPIAVNAYILEDSIKAEGSSLEQHNYSSSIQGGASVLSNWYHNHTLRMSLGGAWGFTTAIPATPVVNTEYTQHVSFSVPANYVKKNLHIVAFASYNGTAANNQKEIINAEEMRLSSTTGVNGFDKTASFIGMYPNPAAATDVIRIEYVLKQGNQVKLSVYNLLGQQIAQPYNSNDASGAHTIHWKPSEQGVAAGTYMLRLETQDGSQSMKVIVR
jgi:thiol-disulfide isomerase/thioredoxin